jgi:hypothetical protein
VEASPADSPQLNPVQEVLPWFIDPSAAAVPAQLAKAASSMDVSTALSMNRSSRRSAE